MKKSIKVTGTSLMMLVVFGSAYYFYTKNGDTILNTKMEDCANSTGTECVNQLQPEAATAFNNQAKLIGGSTANQIESPLAITQKNAVISVSKSEKPRIILPKSEGEISVTRIRK